MVDRILSSYDLKLNSVKAKAFALRVVADNGGRRQSVTRKRRGRRQEPRKMSLWEKIKRREAKDKMEMDLKQRADEKRRVEEKINGVVSSIASTSLGNTDFAATSVTNRERGTSVHYISSRLYPGPAPPCTPSVPHTFTLTNSSSDAYNHEIMMQSIPSTMGKIVLCFLFCIFVLIVFCRFSFR